MIDSEFAATRRQRSASIHRLAATFWVAAFGLAAASAQVELPKNAYRPSQKELVQSYDRANGLRREFESRVHGVRLDPNWMSTSKSLWYMADRKGGVVEFVWVDLASGKKGPLFDHQAVAKSLGAALGKTLDPKKLPISNAVMIDGEASLRITAEGKTFALQLDTGAVTQAEAPGRRNPPPQRPFQSDVHAPDIRPKTSADGAWTAKIEGANVSIKPKEGEAFTAAEAGTDGSYFARLSWSPDSKRLVAVMVHPGDRKPVYLIRSSPPNGGRAVLETRPYELPGDVVDTYDLYTIDPAAKVSKRIDADTIDYGGFPAIRWNKDGSRFTYETMSRGYGRWRLIEADASAATSRAIIDEKSDTFVDSTSQYMEFLAGGKQILYRSERDGWGHLYRIDAETGAVMNRVTSGPWVVRSVVDVDEKSGTVTFTGSGREAEDDPYYIRYYRVGLDGTGLVCLTPASANHQAVFSPDKSVFVDSYSTAGKPPVHELRDAVSGKLISDLERADDSELRAYGWREPEAFVAKGRDGVTDIYGLVYLPMKFDPKLKYPVIEDIYAGPHDSFVPKGYAAYRSNMALAELGFIVVKIDGMGTRNRGKKFQDVSYKNLVDAGLPDRILWMQALAKQRPYMDLGRVGIYGTSAGGQSSTAALLTHPEFYKVAVSSCGCHDNRMDKIWWNEQWMGLMGPHYEAESNITLAPNLKGKLLLFVGEMDHNVPPESTFRLVDAFIKAGKDIDLLVIPGSDHTDGGPYGERKRRDYFVRNLLGVEPPAWNSTETPTGLPARRAGRSS